MTQSRRIQGEIAFPEHATKGTAAKITIELRDVSLQDQASTVVASMTLDRVCVGPNYRIPFEFNAPSVAPSRLLTLRVQVDRHADQRHASGDFLSTIAQPVPAGGDASGLIVPVTQL
jgi:uncharacterized lipoprotein YbaY